VDFGVEQALRMVERFRQCRAFGTQPAEVGRVFLVGFDADFAVIVLLYQYAAAYATVGAGGFGFAHEMNLLYNISENKKP
jgi:hypothetical protein